MAKIIDERNVLIRLVGDSKSLDKTISKATKELRDFGSVANKTSEAVKKGFDSPFKSAAKNVDGLTGSLRGAEKQFSKTGKGLIQTGKQLKGLQGIAASAAGTFAGLFAFNIASQISTGIVGIGSSLVNLAVDAEQTAVSFEVLTGSAEEAEVALAALRKFSVETPFTPDEVIKAGQQLLAFGFKADQLTGTLRKLGNVAASSSNVSLIDLTNIFGKASISGRIMTEDLNQLVERGINILPELAEVLGEPEKELRKLASQNKITFEDLNQAFDKATSEGGKFFGLIEAQSLTLGGRISTLRGIFNRLLETVGERLLPTLKDATETAINFVSALTPEKIIRFAKVLATIVTSFIAYVATVKIAAIATAAYRTATVLAAIAQALFNRNTRRAAAGIRLLTGAIRANPIGLLASAVTLAAGAFITLTSATDDATAAQEKNNEAVAEGIRLREQTTDIATQVAVASQLNKAQLQSLLDRIDATIEATEAKNARVIASEKETAKQVGFIVFGSAKDQQNVSEQTSDELVSSAEGTTASIIDEDKKRLESFRATVLAQLKLVKVVSGETDKERAARLKKEAKEAAERLKKAKEIADELKKRKDDSLLADEKFIREQNKLAKEEADEASKLLDEALKRQQEFAANELEIEKEQAEARDRIDQENAARKQKEREDRFRAEVEVLNRITEANQVAAQAINQIGQALFGQQIDRLNVLIDEQRRAVDESLDNIERGGAEQVQLEENRLQELQNQRARAAQNLRVITAIEVAANQAAAVSAGIVAVANGFKENVFVGIATSVALAATIAGAVISLNNAFGDLPGFATGTEYFEGAGGPKSDSNLARVSKGERIVPTATNEKYFDTLNEFQNGTPMADYLHDIAQGRMSLPVVDVGGGGGKNDGAVVSELQMLNKKMSRLQMSVTLDQDGFSASMSKYMSRKDRFRNKING